MPPAQGVAREGSGLPPREQRLRSVGLSACLAGALLVLLNEWFLIKLSCHTESNALQKSNHPISTQVSLAPKQGAEDKDRSLVQTRGCTNSTPLLSGSQKASRLLTWALPPPWDFLHQHPQPPAPWKPPVGARGNGGHLAAGGRYRGIAEPGTDLLQSWAAEAGNQTSPQLPALPEVQQGRGMAVRKLRLRLLLFLPLISLLELPPVASEPGLRGLPALRSLPGGGRREQIRRAPCGGDAPGPPAPSCGHCPSGRRLTSTFSSVPGVRMSQKGQRDGCAQLCPPCSQPRAPSSPGHHHEPTAMLHNPTPKLHSGTSKPQKLQLELASYHQESISPWQSEAFLGVRNLTC